MDTVCHRILGMESIPLRADGTGTIELVCERTLVDEPQPELRAFVGRGEFGVLVDGLQPGEQVRLFLEEGEEISDSD